MWRSKGPNSHATNYSITWERSKHHEIKIAAAPLSIALTSVVTRRQGIES